MEVRAVEEQHLQESFNNMNSTSTRMIQHKSPNIQNDKIMTGWHSEDKSPRSVLRNRSKDSREGSADTSKSRVSFKNRGENDVIESAQKIRSQPEEKENATEELIQEKSTKKKVSAAKRSTTKTPKGEELQSIEEKEGGSKEEEKGEEDCGEPNPVLKERTLNRSEEGLRNGNKVVNSLPEENNLRRSSRLAASNQKNTAKNQRRTRKMEEGNKEEKEEDEENPEEEGEERIKSWQKEITEGKDEEESKGVGEEEGREKDNQDNEGNEAEGDGLGQKMEIGDAKSTQGSGKRSKVKGLKCVGGQEGIDVKEEMCRKMEELCKSNGKRKREEQEDEEVEGEVMEKRQLIE